MENKKIFHDMKEQMSPDDKMVEDFIANIDSYAEEKELLRKKSKKRYLIAGGVMAACAALAVVGVFIFGQNHPKQKLHSYVLVADAGSANTVDMDDTAAAGGVMEGGAVVSGEEEAAIKEGAAPDGGMPSASVSTEEKESEYEKSYLDVDGDDKQAQSTTEPLFDPSMDGTVQDDDSDVPADVENERVIGVEEEVQLAPYIMYKQLAEYFWEKCGSDKYPDWYGGSYISDNGTGNALLVINVVAGMDYRGSDHFMEKVEDSDCVELKEVKYSLNFLRSIQNKITQLPELKMLSSSWGCGVNEMEGKVELMVAQVDERLLAVLAELDPEDDIIEIQVGEVVSEDDTCKE